MRFNEIFARLHFVEVFARPERLGGVPDVAGPPIPKLAHAFDWNSFKVHIASYDLPSRLGKTVNCQATAIAINMDPQ